MDYVVGFMFDVSGKEVLLIKKTKPEWQKDKLNGIGGKIEPTDRGADHAMAREFHEETGLLTQPEDWVHVITFNDNQGVNTINIFYYDGPPKDIWDAQTTTEEQVVCAYYPLSDAVNQKVIHNVRWTLPFIHEYYVKKMGGKGSVRGNPQRPLVVTFNHD